jgi:hypothetical protein
MVLGLGGQIMARYTAAQWAVESVNGGCCEGGPGQRVLAG